MHNSFQYVVDADPLFGADQNGVARVEADHGLNLFADTLRLGRRQIDFIDYRNNLQVVMQREIGIGESLSFHALRGVHHQQRAFASLQTARNLIRKIDVPGRIDQIQLIHFAVVGAIIQAHRMGLDGDAALALEIHRIEDLRHHLALRQSAGNLKQTIRQRGLAVVDVRNDRKIADEFGIHSVRGLVRLSHRAAGEFGGGSSRFSIRAAEPVWTELLQLPRSNSVRFSPRGALSNRRS